MLILVCNLIANENKLTVADNYNKQFLECQINMEDFTTSRDNYTLQVFKKMAPSRKVSKTKRSVHADYEEKTEFLFSVEPDRTKSSPASKNPFEVFLLLHAALKNHKCFKLL